MWAGSNLTFGDPLSGRGVDTVFGRINTLGAEAEKEPLPVSDFNGINMAHPWYLNIKCWKFDWDGFSSFWDMARWVESWGRVYLSSTFIRQNTIRIQAEHTAGCPRRKLRHLANDQIIKTDRSVITLALRSVTLAPFAGRFSLPPAIYWPSLISHWLQYHHGVHFTNSHIIGVATKLRIIAECLSCEFPMFFFIFCTTGRSAKYENNTGNC